MSAFKKTLHFLDDNLLFFLGLFLLVFIPLYPKIPLADLIPGYIVRLRLEDILVGCSAIIWLIWLLRGKIKLDFPLWKIIAIYLGIGALSIATNVVFTGWIPAEMLHIGKSALHLCRYAEYFFLGFLLYSGCHKKWHFQVVVAALFLTLLAVCVYGWVQKYLYWPVFSTMNREFSKGLVLYLTEHARVQSTFAGHYDFAAWLIMMLPLTFTLSLRQKNLGLKIIGLAIHFFGFWGLVVAASRTSFAAYPVALLVILIIYASWASGSIWRKLARFFGWSCLYGLIALGIMLFAGDDLVERLEQPFNDIDVVRINYENFKQWKLNGAKISDVFHIQAPSNGTAISLADQESNVLVPSDEQPSSEKPPDVYVDIPDQVLIATETATGTAYITEERDRTYSDNALKYGLSLAIRLDALWPQAWAGFLRNPLFGSGYGTLNKTGPGHFTEADSTDNNYLRTLGETGLLGFLAFYSLIVLALIVAGKAFRMKGQPLYRFYALGLVGVIIALAINGTYIDVFVASKVAFTLWSLVGILYALRKYYLHEQQSLVRLDAAQSQRRDRQVAQIVNHNEVQLQVAKTQAIPPKITPAPALVKTKTKVKAKTTAKKRQKSSAATKSTPTTKPRPPQST